MGDGCTKAVDETLDREVAIKTINADLLSPEALLRFRGEAVTLAKLNHPRIASDLRTDPPGARPADGDGIRQGRDLREASRSNRSATGDRAPLCSCDQILDALEHAPMLPGSCTATSKPGNVMVTAIRRCQGDGFRHRASTRKRAH